MEILDDKEIAVSLASSEISIAQIIRHDILECTPDTPIYEAARRMNEARCSSIVITERNKAIGIWTERDALAFDFSSATAAEQPIENVMSWPVLAVSENISLQEVASQFLHESVRHFLVVGESGKPVGVISQTDVVLHQGVEYYLRLRSVETILKNTVSIVDETATLDEVTESMRRNRTDASLVLYADGEYGIFTERDLVYMIAQRMAGCAIGPLASKPLLKVPASCSLYRARNLLSQNGVRHIGVYADKSGVMRGVISFSDILYGMESLYVSELRQALRERDQAFKYSQRNLHLAEKVIESSLEGIFITDPKGVIESVNPAFCRLTGYSSEEVIGQKPSLLSSGRHDEAFYAEMWRSISEAGHWQGEVWNRRKNGEVFPELLTITVIHDEEGNVTNYAALCSDITKLKEDEEHIRSLAYFDPLTNLPNRRLFYDRLAMAIAHAHRNKASLAVLFLDLDHFKQINDKRGHAEGDYVLQEIARRLQEVVREDDTVARMGGDEFVIVLSDITGPEYVVEIAERIIEKVKQPLQLGEGLVQITCSLGISFYPGDGTDVETLIQNADCAMYRAKETGRNGYQLFSKAFSLHNMEPDSLEAALRKALERNELSVELQPLFLTVSEGLYGAEALLRWRHPQLGWISPNDFFPLAEQCGMAIPLSEFVLTTVCEQVSCWNDEGRDVTMVSINIPSSQLYSDGFAEYVRQLLEEYAIRPGQIVFELKESILEEDAAEVIRPMRALRGMGIRLAIDDFGSGYLSLNSLSEYPLDELKIDRAYVQNLDSRPKDAALVSALIQLGHSLGLWVVAKGVERQAALTILSQYQCDAVQGFYYGESLEAKRFAERYFPLALKQKADS